MKIYKFKLEKEIKIKSEDIESILYFFFDDFNFKWYKEFRLKYNIGSIYDSLFNNNEIIIITKDNKEYNLTLDKLMVGIKKFFEKEENDILTESGSFIDDVVIDEFSANYIIQLSIFGEIKYYSSDRSN